MANSFSFNSVDMSTYGLRLRTHDEPFAQETASEQLVDKAYGLSSQRPAMAITLDVVIHAADISTLLSYIDSIKTALNSREDEQFTIDTFTDRYWLARFAGMEKDKNTSTARNWVGEITFICHDPVAYANSPTTSGPHTIDEDPDEVIEAAVGGTEKTEPVFTLTCDATLSDTTVTIENEATGEIIEWTGDLVSTDVLIIDSQNQVVKLNSAEDMVAVDGQFPRLLPGSNTLNIAGFHGSLSILYRARYV